MIKFDLHTHTTKSDGELSPAEMVKLAKAKGLKYLAITDHNTIEGNDEAIAAGKKYGVAVIAGCEFCVEDSFESKTVKNHLLGFNMDSKKIDPVLLKFFDEDNRVMNEVAEKCCQLSQKNPIILSDGSLIKLTFTDLKKITAPDRRMICGEVWAHVASRINKFYNEINKTRNKTIIGLYQVYAIFKKGDQKYIEEYKEILKPYIKSKIGAMGWRTDDDEKARPKMPMLDALSYVAEAGGVSVIAHPGEADQMTKASNFEQKMKSDERYLTYLKKQGLHGLEVYSPKHPPEQIEEYHKISKKLGLLISAGTDFHGPTYSPDKELGCKTQPDEKPAVLLPFREVKELIKILTK
jgi:hypothetical protein